MNILISRCLLGIACRYDGKDNFIMDFKKNFPQVNFIDICPECDGGMKTPRLPCEIKNSKVFNKKGEDMTKFFLKGRDVALKKARDFFCPVGILKEKSPSCGSNFIYDGNFSGNLIKKSGITGDALKKKGLIIFSENNLEEFEKYLKNMGI